MIRSIQSAIASRAGRKRRPTVTVMMPNFNNAAYIGEAIESVQKQTWSDWELLIVDDASTDASPAIAAGFGDERIRMLRLNENVGISPVRNRLLAEAHGRFVTSLDSDDLYWDSEKIESELQLVRTGSPNGRPVIAFGDVNLIDGAGAVIERVGEHRPIREGCLFAAMMRRTIFIPRDFLVSIDVARAAGGFDERLNLYEDWDHKLRLARLADFRFSGRIAVGYRRHGQGLSAADGPTHLATIADIRARYWNAALTRGTSLDVA